MSWKHPGSLALLTLCLAACEGAPDTGASEQTASMQEAPATIQPPGPASPGDTSQPAPGTDAVPGPGSGASGEDSGPAGLPPPSEPREPRILIVPKHYPTIQAAVDAAEAGDTVHVAPGIYTEHVRLKSGIRLSSLGAPYTVLDGQGASQNLIDFTGATDVVITGFTFRNVGSDTHCTMTGDLLRWCGSAWYAAAISADGHDPSSARVEGNIFEHNGIGVLLYFHARAELRGNLFFQNDSALTFPYFQDTATVEGNIFWGNRELAIGVLAGAIDIRRNVIAGSSVGLVHAYVQTGDIRCNVFFQNEEHAAETFYGPPRVVMGENGNVVMDPLFKDPDARDFRLQPDSPLKHLECLRDVSLDGPGPVEP
ncbi:nitrous oxide reductase family maturation protein NosD [Myxococcus sp. RHSTA-1-4]|uniref:right-handed parallel beta-helix repeat-containing protein n=1 Tax=Myxococcus sp. RHSTA-1-4 TaxID=2874601 RepID=UPI001CBE8952|nr:NosD domain-containing protein [Myxococcus sp. RHSTA-1-4]MBZ4417257.1 right-handed parallel beta-helix repeat-containing protein [Myxococcus sp. RHSTA-1-4]